MADGPVGPSADQMMALINATKGASGGSGSAPILMGARLEQNVSQSLALNHNALLKADGKMQFANPARDGLLSKIFKEMKGEGIFAGLQKVAQAGAPRQIGSITEITGSGMAGGFVASASMGQSNDSGIST